MMAYLINVLLFVHGAGIGVAGALELQAAIKRPWEEANPVDVILKAFGWEADAGIWLWRRMR